MLALEAQQGFRKRLEPARRHQRLAGQTQQAVQALRGDAQHTLGAGMCLGRWSGGGNGRFARPHRNRAWIHVLCGFHIRYITSIQQSLEIGQKRGHCDRAVTRQRTAIRLWQLANLQQQISTTQQQVDMLLLQPNGAALGGHKTIFHCMRQVHTRIEANNAGRALERVRSAHAGLQVVGRRCIALQRQKASGQDLGLALGLQAEQLLHRHLAQIAATHARLRLMV